jgi:hypothetical protein
VIDKTPPQETGLQYRMAVAFCTAVVIGLTMLLVPLIVGIVGGGAESLALYAIVFSKWGLATVIVFAITGFILGGERMANVFAAVWGTHPVWSELGSWLEEHETAAAMLGFSLVVLVVGFFWYSFR